MDNAADAKKALFCPNGIYWTHGSRLTAESRAHKTLAAVYDRLSQIRQDLRSESRFEPEHLWAVLQNLDLVLKEIWAGRADLVDASLISSSESDRSASVRRYGSNDDFEAYGEEDDEYYGEEYYDDDEDEEDYDEYDKPVPVHVNTGSRTAAAGSRSVQKGRASVGKR